MEVLLTLLEQPLAGRGWHRMHDFVIPIDSSLQKEITASDILQAPVLPGFAVGIHGEKLEFFGSPDFRLHACVFMHVLRCVGL